MNNNGTVLITGASSGIGFELAKIFSKNNFNLVVVARNKKKLERAAEKFVDDSIFVLSVVQDLATPGAPQEIYNILQEKNNY